MLHKDTSGREIRSFYSFSAFSTDDCKSRLSRSRGHFMLQLSMSNDFEALIDSYEPILSWNVFDIYTLPSLHLSNETRGAKSLTSTGSEPFTRGRI
jgi:hypothetical protein